VEPHLKSGFNCNLDGDFCWGRGPVGTSRSAQKPCGPRADYLSARPRSRLTVRLAASASTSTESDW
jgi:hypothetical protein